VCLPPKFCTVRKGSEEEGFGSNQRGKLTVAGIFPPGLLSPNIVAARAVPPWTPGMKASIIAGAVDLRSSIEMSPPFTRTYQHESIKELRRRHPSHSDTLGGCTARRTYQHSHRVCRDDCVGEGDLGVTEADAVAVVTLPTTIPCIINDQNDLVCCFGHLGCLCDVGGSQDCRCSSHVRRGDSVRD
jgi:hypothetical protein